MTGGATTCRLTEHMPKAEFQWPSSQLSHSSQKFFFLFLKLFRVLTVMRHGTYGFLACAAAPQGHETPSQASPSDIRLAHSLCLRRITLETVEAAMLLASVRRSFRDPSLPSLSPIRSLNYFLPVIGEISANPLPEGYLHYLRFKLESYVLLPNMIKRNG